MASGSAAMSQTPDIAEADLFTIPLLDGGVGLGQIIAPDLNGAVQCLISDLRGTEPRAIPGAHVLAILYTQPRPFQTRSWTVIGYDTLPAVARPRRSLLLDPPIVHDPAVIEAFLNAAHGLYPWDGFPDPGFFASLLLPGVPEPEPRRLKSQFS